MKRDLYMAEREKGKTYRQIAEEFGVSYQRVAEACARNKQERFCPFTEDRCAYPNLRRWLNENRVGTSELSNRLGYSTCSRTNCRIRDYLRGIQEPTKRFTKAMEELTGMKREELYETGGRR